MRQKVYKQRIHKGIYINPKIPEKVYCQMMIRGINYYESFEDVESAIAYRDEIVDSNKRHETDIHPLILRQGNQLVLEINFSKYYSDDEEGAARALKIATILDKLMDEEQ
jgi:hypothetical protein